MGYPWRIKTPQATPSDDLYLTFARPTHSGNPAIGRFTSRACPHAMGAGQSRTSVPSVKEIKAKLRRPANPSGMTRGEINKYVEARQAVGQRMLHTIFPRFNRKRDKPLAMK